MSLKTEMVFMDMLGYVFFKKIHIKTTFFNLNQYSSKNKLKSVDFALGVSTDVQTDTRLIHI